MGTLGARRVIRLANGVLLSADFGTPDVQGPLGEPGSIYVDLATGRRYSLGHNGEWDFDHYQNLDSLSGFIDDAIVYTSVDHVKNYAGQVKAYASNMFLTGFDNDVYRNFEPAGMSFVMAPWPTTTWPINMVNPTKDDVFDCVTPRIKENPVMGQAHTWRFNGVYSGKAQNNAGGLNFEMYNPDSGFFTVSEVILPQGRTSGKFSCLMHTIADGESIGAGKGYRFRLKTSFTDNDLTITVNDILRVSHCVESVRVL